MDFDKDAYELALSQEREVLNLSIIKFDPTKHKRDLLGRFRKMVWQMNEGDTIELPDGTFVDKSHGSGEPGSPRMLVGKPGHEPMAIVNFNESADKALELTDSVSNEDVEATKFMDPKELEAGDYGDEGIYPKRQDDLTESDIDLISGLILDEDPYDGGIIRLPMIDTVPGIEDVEMKLFTTGEPITTDEWDTMLYQAHARANAGNGANRDAADIARLARDFLREYKDRGTAKPDKFSDIIAREESKRPEGLPSDEEILDDLGLQKVDTPDPRGIVRDIYGGSIPGESNMSPEGFKVYSEAQGRAMSIPEIVDSGGDQFVITPDGDPIMDASAGDHEDAVWFEIDRIAYPKSPDGDKYTISAGDESSDMWEEDLSRDEAIKTIWKWIAEIRGLNMNFDKDTFERELNLARLDAQGQTQMGIRYARLDLSIIKFDPTKHKRNLLGQFRKMVHDLGPTDSVELPDGTFVDGANGGRRLVGRPGDKSVKPKVFHDDSGVDAAIEALQRSNYDAQLEADPMTERYTDLSDDAKAILAIDGVFAVTEHETGGFSVYTEPDKDTGEAFQIQMGEVPEMTSEGTEEKMAGYAGAMVNSAITDKDNPADMIEVTPTAQNEFHEAPSFSILRDTMLPDIIKDLKSRDHAQEPDETAIYVTELDAGEGMHLADEFASMNNGDIHQVNFGDQAAVVSKQPDGSYVVTVADMTDENLLEAMTTKGMTAQDAAFLLYHLASGKGLAGTAGDATDQEEREAAAAELNGMIQGIDEETGSFYIKNGAGTWAFERTFDSDTRWRLTTPDGRVLDGGPDPSDVAMDSHMPKRKRELPEIELTGLTREQARQALLDSPTGVYFNHKDGSDKVYMHSDAEDPNRPYSLNRFDNNGMLRQDTETFAAHNQTLDEIFDTIGVQKPELEAGQFVRPKPGSDGHQDMLNDEWNTIYIQRKNEDGTYDIVGYAQDEGNSSGQVRRGEYVPDVPLSAFDNDVIDEDSVRYELASMYKRVGRRGESEKILNTALEQLKNVPHLKKVDKLDIGEAALTFESADGKIERTVGVAEEMDGEWSANFWMKMKDGKIDLVEEKAETVLQAVEKLIQHNEFWSGDPE